MFSYKKLKLQISFKTMKFEKFTLKDYFLIQIKKIKFEIFLNYFKKFRLNFKKLTKRLM